MQVYHQADKSCCKQALAVAHIAVPVYRLPKKVFDNRVLRSFQAAITCQASLPCGAKYSAI